MIHGEEEVKSVPLTEGEGGGPHVCLGYGREGGGERVNIQNSCILYVDTKRQHGLISKQKLCYFQFHSPLTSIVLFLIIFLRE